MATQIDPWQDQAQRLAPSKSAVQAAVAALDARPEADAAVVPLYMPGKSFGVWTVGQQVETIELTGEDVLVGVNPNRPTGAVPAIRDRIATAFDLANAQLAEHGRGGTTGYVIVRPDGSWVVFEEIRSATS